MIRIGEKIKLIHDPRPFGTIKTFEAEVIRATKTGFKIKNITESGLYESELFYPDRTVRGWNTLTWMY